MQKVLDSCNVGIPTHQQLLKKTMYCQETQPEMFFQYHSVLQYHSTYLQYHSTYFRTLVRSSDDDAIFKAAAVGDAGKVKLSKISWMMPRVQPNVEMKYKLCKSIESKVVLDAAFRMRQGNIVEIPQSTTMSW